MQWARRRARARASCRSARRLHFSPEIVAYGSDCRPTNPPGTRAVPRRGLLPRKSSPTAPIAAQPTLQAPAPFHGAASCPGNRRRAVPLSAQSTRQGVGAVRVGDTHPANGPDDSELPPDQSRRELLLSQAPSAAPRQPWELTPYAIALSMKGRRHPPRRRGSRGSRPPSRSSGRWSPAAPAPSFREQALGQSAAIVRPGRERSCAALPAGFAAPSGAARTRCPNAWARYAGFVSLCDPVELRPREPPPARRPRVAATFRLVPDPAADVLLRCPAGGSPWPGDQPLAGRISFCPCSSLSMLNPDRPVVAGRPLTARVWVFTLVCNNLLSCAELSEERLSGPRPALGRDRRYREPRISVSASSPWQKLRCIRPGPYSAQERVVQRSKSPKSGRAEPFPRHCRPVPARRGVLPRAARTPTCWSRCWG